MLFIKDRIYKMISQSGACLFIFLIQVFLSANDFNPDSIKILVMFFYACVSSVD